MPTFTCKVQFVAEDRNQVASHRAASVQNRISLSYDGIEAINSTKYGLQSDSHEVPYRLASFFPWSLISFGRGGELVEESLWAALWRKDLRRQLNSWLIWQGCLKLAGLPALYKNSRIASTEETVSLLKRIRYEVKDAANGNQHRSMHQQ